MPPENIQERAFRFAVAVVQFCRDSEHLHPVSRRLTWQLLDSATSIGANMEEADVAQSPRDFVNKVAVARKESREALFWIRLLCATDPKIRQPLQILLDESRQLTKIVGAIKKNAERNLPKRAGRRPADSQTP